MSIEMGSRLSVCLSVTLHAVEFFYYGILVVEWLVYFIVRSFKQ